MLQDRKCQKYTLTIQHNWALKARLGVVENKASASYNKNTIQQFAPLNTQNGTADSQRLQLHVGKSKKEK